MLACVHVYIHKAYIHTYIHTHIRTHTYTYVYRHDTYVYRHGHVSTSLLRWRMIVRSAWLLASPRALSLSPIFNGWTDTSVCLSRRLFLPLVVHESMIRSTCVRKYVLADAGKSMMDHSLVMSCPVLAPSVDLSDLACLTDCVSHSACLPGCLNVLTCACLLACLPVHRRPSLSSPLPSACVRVSTCVMPCDSERPSPVAFGRIPGGNDGWRPFSLSAYTHVACL